MNFTSITNNIDVNIIFNVSIGVIIGLGVTHSLSNLFSTLIQKAFPYLWKLLLHKIQPVTLSVRARMDLSKKYDTLISLPDSITQLFGKQDNIQHAIKLYLEIYTDKLRCSSLYNNYRPTIIVNWIDRQNKINIHKNPIGNNVQRIGEFPLDITRPQLIRLQLMPKVNWQEIRNYEVYIQLFFENKEILHKIVLSPTYDITPRHNLHTNLQ